MFRFYLIAFIGLNLFAARAASALRVEAQPVNGMYAYVCVCVCARAYALCSPRGPRSALRVEAQPR